MGAVRAETGTISAMDTGFRRYNKRVLHLRQLLIHYTRNMRRVSNMSHNVTPVTG